MNRNEKIAKLGNAIWEYRGRYDPKTGAWKQHPRPSAAARIFVWLKRLGLEPHELRTIQEFKTAADFNAWIKKI
jgi:hypothetical protein